MIVVNISELEILNGVEFNCKKMCKVSHIGSVEEPQILTGKGL
uniref:Uncharacterized protein n=1 Tax=Rhizophora mucronata TaxID=61149 RepID=A0A2P2III5_RHIMU